MIALHASGGLGNQLFNYAAARTLADRTHSSLVVDVDAYRDQWEANATRPHALHRFPVRATFRNLGPNRVHRPLISRLARRLREDTFAAVVDRPSGEIGYFPGFRELRGRTILKGHFISPRFFHGNEERIRQDLTLGVDALGSDEVAIQTLARIRSHGHSVAVHVRRADWVDGESSWLLVPNMPAYYHQAFERMVARLGKAVFWLFSNDPGWCRETFSGVAVDLRFVDALADSSANPVKDFFLMTQCDHFIIANSAFSWWAAWLGRRTDKVVMAPGQWDRLGTVAMVDLIPSDWEMIRW